MKKIFKKSAFTLAEVLITLSIIGVVAALTIPNLVQKYRRYVVETKLRQTVNILNQAIIHSASENETPDKWEYSYSLRPFDTYILPYLKAKTICDHVTYIKGNTDICNSYIEFYNNENKSFNGPERKYLLANGSIIGYINVGSASTKRKMEFYIQPVYKKEKLVVGKNIFEFVLHADSEKYFVSASRNYTNTDICKRIPRSELIESCTNDDSIGYGFAQGYACSALIECNGWKIPNDYPIKF